MHTFQIRVSDEIITKFLWLLEYFKKDIEIIKLSTDNDFISSMNESKKDIEKGNKKGQSLNIYFFVPSRERERTQSFSKVVYFKEDKRLFEIKLS